MDNARSLSDNPKILRIVECVLSIMREHGDKGLSMRKVAAEAGMSLSNLQYYFANREALLQGMVDVYFQRCVAELDFALRDVPADNAEETVARIVQFGFESTHADTGRIFRELWVVAERDETLLALLQAHYRTMASDMVKLLAPLAVDAAAAERAVSVLIPFFEGVRNLGPALPIEAASLSETVKEQTLALMRGEEQGRQATSAF